LVEDLEASHWFCGYWATDELRAMSEQNQENRQSKPSMHHYGMDGHVLKMQKMVRKTHNFNS
jgi:hypothetical protein